MLSFSHFPSISSILPLSLPLYSNTINRAANLFYSTRRREAALTELRGKSEMLPSSEANHRLFTAVCATFAFISIFLVRRRFEFHRLRSKDFIWRVFWHIKSFWKGHDKHGDAAQYKNICRPKRCRCVCKSWLMPTNQHSHTWQTCSFFSFAQEDLCLNCLQVWKHVLRPALTNLETRHGLFDLETSSQNKKTVPDSRKNQQW